MMYLLVNFADLLRPPRSLSFDEDTFLDFSIHYFIVKIRYVALMYTPTNKYNVKSKTNKS